MSNIKEMSLSEKLTYSTVLIKSYDSFGNLSTGTGFIMHLCCEDNKACPCIITNKHVIKGAVKVFCEICKKDELGNPDDRIVDLMGLHGEKENWIMHPEDDVDLCCYPFGKWLNVFSTKFDPFYIPLETSLIPTQEQLCGMSAIEDITMIGYPIGISDSHNHKPIIRKGITATHVKNNYNNSKQFLIDAACFPGSSGSPVFILNEGIFKNKGEVYLSDRIVFLGILFAGPMFNAKGNLQIVNIPTSVTPILNTNIPVNLGIVVKSEKILDFEIILKKQIMDETPVPAR